jgi:ankyrin repeat protein
MSANQEELGQDHRQWSECDLVAKLGGGPYELASSSLWPRSLAFMRHSGTVENFQHAVWGLAENVNIEDRETSSTIESYLRSVPNGITDWVNQLRFEKLTSHKFSPLAKFICNYRHNTAAILMQAGMHPDFSCDSSGRTAIQACVMSGTFNVDGLTALLGHGASPNGEREARLCQLHVDACQERPIFSLWKRFPQSEAKPMETKEQIFVQLMASNAAIHELDSAGSNMAHVLCTVGSSVSVSDVIAMRRNEAKSLFVAARKSDGFMPIHVACSFGHSQLLPTLIALGARPSAIIDKFMVKDKDAYCCFDLGASTCFYLALINGRSSGTAMIIFKNSDATTLAASVHAATGTTPLHWCVWHHVQSLKDTDDITSLINALITNGCSIEKRDNAGRLPIHLACAGGHHSLIPILAPTAQLINDRLTFPSQSPQVNASKINRLRVAMKKSASASMALIDKSEIIIFDDVPDAGIIIENDVESAQPAIEIGSERVNGTTPLLLAIMSKDIRCVKSALSVQGILKFQMSTEPTATTLTVLAPTSPFAVHFGTVVSSTLDAKSKIVANDVLSRFKSAERNGISPAALNLRKPDIHSPLSFAMITAQFDIVDLILATMSETEPIVLHELIQSNFRCKDDFFLLLVSSIVKAAKQCLLPRHFQNLIPDLEELISSQLESIPSFAATDEKTNVNETLLDSHVNQMLSRLSNIQSMPKSSDGMPANSGSVNSDDRNSLGSIHMICILGYSQCCESLMKANPLQNYSLRSTSGLISPLHLCILYKRLACFKSLIELSPPNLLSTLIQEPLLNHLMPIHTAVLSGNLEFVIDICSAFNSLNISHYEFIARHPAFAFQLLARAGSGYDLEITSLQGSAKFLCIALNPNTSESIYSNHLTIGYDGGPIAPFLDELNRCSNTVFLKLDSNCIDSLVLCSLYGLTTHCRYLLSKSLPCKNKKSNGYFADSFGSWIPMQVSLIQNWSKMTEVASWTPVNVAVHRGHRDIICLLLSYGHDCNTRSPFGWTPLTLACFYGNTNLVEVLLEHLAIVSRPDAAGWTPVMVCITKLGPRRIHYSVQVTGEWSIESARDRLSNSIAKGLTDQSDDGPVRAAAILPMFEQFQSLSATSADGNTLIINSLLGRCDVSSEFSPYGWSALYTAIFLQQLSIVSTLLEAKADVNEGCMDGRKPLYAACSIPHIPLVLHLLKLRADPNPAVPRTRTKLTLQKIISKEGTGQLLPQYQCLPIVAACKMGSISVVLALLAACRSVSTFPDAEIVNAAASACIESISIHVLGLLLVHPVTRRHAMLSISESFRGTCLLSLMLWASDACQLWALRAALAFGADVNGMKNGTSSLHIVCSRSQCFKMAIYLVEQARRAFSPHISKIRF